MVAQEVVVALLIALPARPIEMASPLTGHSPNTHHLSRGFFASYL